MMSSTTHPRRETALKAAAATIGMAGLLAGCGGSEKDNGTPAAAKTSESTTSTTATTAAPATAAPATTAAAGGAPVAAPAGASQLQNASANGATYWRYSITGTTAAQVVADYQTELQGAGYTVADQGGGGGGWGKWGGAGAGLTGQNGGTHVAVQAGGQSGAPVYFEVCSGPSAQSVQDCENVSEGPDGNDSNSSSS